MDANRGLDILPERAVKTDQKTISYLRQQLQLESPSIEGKLCVARVGNDVVLAIGHPSSSLHMRIINDACRELLGSEVARDDFSSGKAKVVISDGAIVEGISFSFDLSSETMEFEGTSRDFGGFQSKIFKDDTISVAQRFLKDLVKKLKDNER